jgi:hypothetical protein
MKKTTLKFSNLADLVQFQKAIEMFSYRINASAITLTGQFSNNDILLAKEKYKGKILLSEPTLQEQEY